VALIGSGSITVLVARFLAIGTEDESDEHEENSI
jgi:hypothetical protein